MRIQCSLVVPTGDDERLANHVVVITVEDVSIMDGNAAVIARATVPVREVRRDGTTWGPVVLDLPERPPAARWNVRAQVSAGRALAEGDLVSTRAVPGAAGGGEVTVPLVAVVGGPPLSPTAPTGDNGG